MEFHHYGIYCEDLDRAAELYQKTLGFRPMVVTRVEGGPRMVWLVSAAGTRIELLEAPDRSVTDAQGRSMNHLAYRVGDISEALALAESHGFSILRGPFDSFMAFDEPLAPEDADLFAVSGPAGVRAKILYFFGPAGELIECIQDNIAGT